MYSNDMAVDDSDVKRVPVSAAVLPEIADRLESLAKSLSRSRSQICEKLLVRGLAAYDRDHSLDEATRVDNAELQKTLEEYRAERERFREKLNVDEGQVEKYRAQLDSFQKLMDEIQESMTRLLRYAHEQMSAEQKEIIPELGAEKQLERR